MKRVEMKPADHLLCNQEYTLQRMPGKGGWTYIDLPHIAPNRKNPFGWVQVKGTIDGFPISKYHLMPFGNGRLFLPVRAEIRKRIKKEAGEAVQVVLYTDDAPMEVPEEFLVCLQDEPSALQFFNTLAENEKQNYLKWIYAPKTEQVRIQRMAAAVSRLVNGERLYGGAKATNKE